MSLKSALSTLDLNCRRSALGASSALDVLRVEEEVQRARGQVISADESVRRSRGRWGSRSVAARTTASPPTSSSTSSRATRARAAGRRRTSTSVRTSEPPRPHGDRGAPLQGVDWSYWPTVDAVSSLTYWSNEDATANGKHLTWTVGGLLTWELYDGGFRYGTREVYESDLVISKQNLTEAKRQAQVEVIQTTARCRSRRRTWP